MFTGFLGWATSWWTPAGLSHLPRAELLEWLDLTAVRGEYGLAQASQELVQAIDRTVCLSVCLSVGLAWLAIASERELDRPK